VLRESLAAPPLDLDLQPGDALSTARAGCLKRAARPAPRRLPHRSRDRPARLGLVQARAQLRAFLQAAAAPRLRCVRIVHGKGLRSGQRGPVLKQRWTACLRRAGADPGFHVGGMRDVRNRRPTLRCCARRSGP